MNIIEKIKSFFGDDEWVKVSESVRYSKVEETDYAHKIRVYCVDKYKNPETNEVDHKVIVSWGSWVWKEEKPTMAKRIKEDNPIRSMYDDVDVYPYSEIT